MQSNPDGKARNSYQHYNGHPYDGSSSNSRVQRIERREVRGAKAMAVPSEMLQMVQVIRHGTLSAAG
jgi:hypothetical protein